jgi:predicted membrane GTPase involved in stress response
VTPKSLRLRKRILSEIERKKQTRKENKAARV